MVSSNYGGYSAMNSYSYPTVQGGPGQSGGYPPPNMGYEGPNDSFQMSIDQMTGDASSVYRDTIAMLDNAKSQGSSSGGGGGGDSGGGGGFLSGITKPFTDIVDGVGGAIGGVIDSVFSIF